MNSCLFCFNMLCALQNNVLCKVSNLRLTFNFEISCIASSRIFLSRHTTSRLQYLKHGKRSISRFDTYRHRVLTYFRTDCKYKKNCVNVQAAVQGISANDSLGTVMIKHVKNEETLKISSYNLSQDCLENTIYKLSSNLGRLNHKFYANVMDAICCTRLDGMTAQEILRLLDAWMHALPNEITKTGFYKALLQNFKTPAVIKTLSVEEAIQYIFYFSLQKRGVSNIIQLLYNKVEENMNLQFLTLEELCIIVTSAFQSSTKLLSIKLLLQLENVLQTHMNQLLDDTQLLIAVIKAFRQARHYNYELLDSLAANLLNKKLPNYSFTVRTHIMIMYADALYGREDITKEIIVLNVEDILAKNNSIRAKDISSFLWAAGYLGVAMDSYVLENVFTPEIMCRIRRNEFRKNPSDIIDSALSLWMLGYKADALYVEATAPSVVSSLEGKMRFQSRLQLLLTCVAIEAPDLLQQNHKILMKEYAKLPDLNTRQELRKRPSLQKVYTALKYLATNLGLKSVQCKSVIPHLNIGGVVLTSPSGQINVEVLDDRVCLHKSRQPHGVMKLKLRLLSAIGSELLIVNDEDDYMDSMESLMIFLEDSVKERVT